MEARYDKSPAISRNVRPASFDEMMPATLADAGLDRRLHPDLSHSRRHEVG